MRGDRWCRTMALLCVGGTLVLTSPAQAGDWESTAEAVPQAAGSMYDSVASRVGPVLSWSYGELQRVPSLLYEGKDLVMTQVDRLRNLPGMAGPDYSSLHKL